MTEIDLEEYWDDIYRAARRVRHAYGGRFDADDIAQGIAADVLQYPSRYSGFGGDFHFLILKRAGLRYCATQAASFLTFADQHLYSAGELKTLLPRYYEPGVWPNGLKQPALDDYDNKAEFQKDVEEWAECTALHVDMADLDEAIGLLSGAQRKIIEKRYRDKMKLTTKHDRNTHSAALRFLTYHMNDVMARRRRAVDGPGRRLVQSNGECIQATRRAGISDTGALGRDAVSEYATIMARTHPDHRPSRHVIGSPWRPERGEAGEG